MDPHTVIHMWEYSSVLLLERHWICQLDLVLDQGYLAQVQVAVGK